MTGLYARQVEEAGWLGLAGYLLFSLFWALLTALYLREAFILPLLATEAPAFVEGFLGIVNGHRRRDEPRRPPGALWRSSGILYLLGGLLFGIATFRAGILPRWAAGLLAVGAVAPLAAGAAPARARADSWRCRWGSRWPGWAMRSGRNGESTPRTPSLAGEAPSSAKPQPSKVAGNRMEWTGGRAAACLIGTRSSPDDSPPMVMTPHHLARELRNAR